MALGQKEIGDRVRTYTRGMAGSATELMLYAIRFNMDLGSSGEHVWDEESNKALKEINFSSFKRALTHLRSKGYVNEVEGTTTGFQLTEAGIAEVAKFIPQYREERDWNGKVYLVNYDLPVTSNSARNAFRDYIKSIGCGLVQHSLWLTPFDPREKLTSYLESHEIDKSNVIVSSVNLEVELYSYQIPSLIEKAFGLEKINNKYKEYINAAENGLSRERRIFAFLEVLKNDPQAPYDLIPDDWAGYRAYELFKESLG